MNRSKSSAISIAQTILMISNGPALKNHDLISYRFCGRSFLTAGEMFGEMHEITYKLVSAREKIGEIIINRSNLFVLKDFLKSELIYTTDSDHNT